MTIAARLFDRCGELVDLATRTDVTDNVTGGLVETYSIFATVEAKVVEIGSLHGVGGDVEQIQEGVTHIVIVTERPDGMHTEYVMYGTKRLRVQRHRMIGPPDIRFRQFLCEELERA